MNCVPVIDAKGQAYPSVRACARAYGVHRQVVSYHLDTYGDLSRLGMGQRRVNPQNAAKPVRIGPLSWPSATAAAADLGLSLSQLRRRMAPDASPALRDDLIRLVMQSVARAGGHRPGKFRKKYGSAASSPLLLEPPR
ncbi:hypothetical protein Shpa_53 [Paracoccus phage Shpa]|uniref:Uncharacterized protein n=1 Tax=Paracoccus phage Shpa TaxID=1647282 RepID=A0A0U2BXS5_9CAUD|nr:hypothetical protein FDG85_gp52 [Paracoccus phage Shpa]AKG94563.1 hypothetical protein Shpa_53 [Paracoccus phage Shpa]